MTKSSPERYCGPRSIGGELTSGCALVFTTRTGSKDTRLKKKAKRSFAIRRTLFLSSICRSGILDLRSKIHTASSPVFSFRQQFRHRQARRLRIGPCDPDPGRSEQIGTRHAGGDGIFGLPAALGRRDRGRQGRRDRRGHSSV